MGIAKVGRSINKKKTSAPKIADTVKPGEVCVVLDHPQQGENITAPCYTFRAGTIGEIARVEISINEGPWRPCRNSVGYWWYDWSDYAGGRYQAVVRAQAKNDKVFTSGPCKFQVALSADGKPSKALKVKP